MLLFTCNLQAVQLLVLNFISSFFPSAKQTEESAVRRAGKSAVPYPKNVKKTQRLLASLGGGT